MITQRWEAALKALQSWVILASSLLLKDNRAIVFVTSAATQKQMEPCVRPNLKFFIH